VAVASARRVIAQKHVMGSQRESNNEQFMVKAFALLESELLRLTST